jgi:hypothetical protein
VNQFKENVMGSTRLGTMLGNVEGIPEALEKSIWV